MNEEYNKFLEWVNKNNIKLYPYQENVLKAFFNGDMIKIPRQNGRNYGIELIAEFYKSNSKYD